eukprot:TRINITY_DN5223_c0_g1_i2.p1 TRINITY_DN5223_c0_g1~~TRINITY_DN5223_c0_g1_i2.p1  ORF type:complete len:122 (+),score=30.95 TRINITY_DN5223_c0_g1_i2:510-875(+)
MLNASPVGRACSQEQRDEFYEFDKQNKVRGKLIEQLKIKCDGWGIQFSIGGQISVDIFPVGWDKTLCLENLVGFEKIYFFGDKTQPGENDYEIFASDKTIGNNVTGPDHTIRLLKELFLDV